jgi:hypothetical protein
MVKRIKEEEMAGALEFEDMARTTPGCRGARRTPLAAKSVSASAARASE